MGRKKRVKTYMADFETTSETQYNIDGETKVWGAILMNIDTEESELITSDLNEFLNYLQLDDEHHSSKVVYFHNLKFDAQFILPVLFKNGFTHTTERKANTKEFTTLVSDTGAFYEIKVVFKRYGTRANMVTFRDSFKKLPFSVEAIGKSFNVGAVKGNIDYDTYREFPYTITEEEKDYMINDVLIIARALKIQLERGLDKMTIGSDSLSNYKSFHKKDWYDYHFPQLLLDVDREIRKSYKGGWTYMKPEYEEVVLENVLEYDVNSLYPYIMRTRKLPYGKPIFFKDEYVEDKEYNLYVQAINVEFRIKENHLPMIQMKNSSRFIPTEYITSSGDEPVFLFLTSVDLQLFKDHYDILYIEYLGGYKFKSVQGLFDNFIDFWYNERMNTTGAKNATAKLMLNNLYGKFGTNPIVQSKSPYYENGVVKWKLEEEEEGKGGYIPMASFITSYAREYTIRSAQKLFPHFVYSDTDSIKLINITEEEVAKVIWTSEEKILGAWDFEGKAERGKFLRAKTYIMDYGNKTSITCAGLPKDARANIGFDEFNLDLEVDGKLMQKTVEGGVILKNTTFKFRHKKEVKK